MHQDDVPLLLSFSPFWKDPKVSWEHFSQPYAHVHSDLTVAAQNLGVSDVKLYTHVMTSNPSILGFFSSQSADRSKGPWVPDMKENAKDKGYDVADYDDCSTLYFKSFGDAQIFF